MLQAIKKDRMKVMNTRHIIIITKLISWLTQDLNRVRHFEGLAQDGDLADVVPGILRANALELEAVAGAVQAETRVSRNLHFPGWQDIMALAPNDHVVT